MKISISMQFVKVSKGTNTTIYVKNMMNVNDAESWQVNFVLDSDSGPVPHLNILVAVYPNDVNEVLLFV